MGPLDQNVGLGIHVGSWHVQVKEFQLLGYHTGPWRANLITSSKCFLITNVTLIIFQGTWTSPKGQCHAQYQTCSSDDSAPHILSHAFRKAMQVHQTLCVSLYYRLIRQKDLGFILKGISGHFLLLLYSQKIIKMTKYLCRSSLTSGKHVSQQHV